METITIIKTLKKTSISDIIDIAINTKITIPITVKINTIV
jgi:hypothetical protein